MSYDIWLEMDTGGDEPAQVGEDYNMTSNVAGIWGDALGYSLRGINGKIAGDYIDDFEKAPTIMKDPQNESKYRAMEPSNGWGSLESATKFIGELLELFTAHPKASIRVFA